jgi:hypothetical protein
MQIAPLQEIGIIIAFNPAGDHIRGSRLLMAGHET